MPPSGGFKDKVWTPNDDKKPSAPPQPAKKPEEIKKQLTLGKKNSKQLKVVP